MQQLNPEYEYYTYIKKLDLRIQDNYDCFNEQIAQTLVLFNMNGSIEMDGEKNITL